MHVPKRKVVRKKRHWREGGETKSYIPMASLLPARQPTSEKELATQPHIVEATSLPYTVLTLENVRIPVLRDKHSSDNTKILLSATVWLPQSHDTCERFPVVIECIPYRRGDGTIVRDSKRHPYLAGHGIAAVRVDLRGCGDSEGTLFDEYLESELLDCVEVIEWASTQSWSNGNVGMFGKSWGAFNALQVAALQPPSLKAIIAVSGTVDRYDEDIHYVGGCVHGLDALTWGSYMFPLVALPPDPLAVGKQWKELWVKERLHVTADRETPQHPSVEWLRHQLRDAYWKHGSVCENYHAIQVPTLAVGGWADGYTSFVFELLSHMDKSVPCSGIVGPWAHQYPEEGQPGPTIAFAQESIGWWHRWLSSPASPEAVKATKVYRNDDVQHNLRCYLLDWEAPCRSYLATRPGRWCHFPSWERPRDFTLHLGRNGTLTTDTCPDAGVVTTDRDCVVGKCMGSWWGFGTDGGGAQTTSAPMTRCLLASTVHLSKVRWRLSATQLCG